MTLQLGNQLAKDFYRSTVKGKNGAKNNNTTEVEHILAVNDKNHEMFGNDIDRFNSERNKVGALLLLKSSENKSSGNDIYSEKLKTYANTNNYWAKTLTEGFYHSTNIEFRRLRENYPSLNFNPIESFDQVTVKNRQKLLFELIKIIWGDEYFTFTNE